MESKWIVIGFIGWMLVFAGGMAIEQHEKNQCRIAALSAGKNSTDIETICK